MSNPLTLTINGISVSVPQGATLAVALALAGQPCRMSITGAPRGPLCGMGICFECRVVVNGKSHCRSCQILCAPGMEVRTNE
jgi:D-hydroxyproline dehydrogenase subunit gamma